MSAFGDIINGAFDILNLSIPLFGYSFTYWQVLLFSFVAGLILYAIFRFFD